jgi:septal ring factor EnvC (AmiA/AmiB activator)
LTASRCSDGRLRWLGGLAAGLALALVPVCLGAAAPQMAGQDPQERAAQRMRVLQNQADALLAEEGVLLGQLRALEFERQLRVEEVAQAARDRAAAQGALDAAVLRSEQLRRTAAGAQPEIAGRLVRVYKLGRVGFWRLLLDMDSLAAANRAYRTAAALTRIDTDRVATYQHTLDALTAEQHRLGQQLEAIAAIESRATRSRNAAATAVESRAALVKAIDARRDLNAQLTGELAAAQRRLQAAVGQLGPGTGASRSLPLRPFQGTLPWPARGRVIGRFGPSSGKPAVAGAAPNGIVIALLEGQRVRAVHDGTVAFAAPFAAYGHLVIVQHGDQTYSLYGHLEALAVSKGARVEAGTPLGSSGTDPSGNPSLYFELRVDGRPVDPLQWLIRE